MMGLYDEHGLFCSVSSLVCTCVGLPPNGHFTIGKTYGFVNTEKFIEIMDNHEETIFLSENDFYLYFNQIGEAVTSVLHPMMYDKTIYHIYLVLEHDTCSLDEIKAYAKILHLNYVQAKYALTNKRNLLASGDACDIKEILYKLCRFQVHYEIEPPYPYQ